MPRCSKSSLCVSTVTAAFTFYASVVSAVRVSSFGYQRQAPGLGKGLLHFKIFQGNVPLFHHGLVPDGLTLSAGGLAATSLKTDHCAFVCY